MKKTLALAATLLTLAATSAFALVGGPWDSNIYGNPNKVDPSNYDGTYQGTVKGKNLSGLFAFGTSTAGTSGESGYSETVVSGTGNNRTEITYTYPGTVQGYAVVYLEGKVAYAYLSVVQDLGSRKLSGVMQGAGAPASGSIVVSNGTTSWTVVDAVTFTGTWDAKLSKSWALNSFTGKGSLQVTKVDLATFYSTLLTNPSAAVPQIVNVSTSIKVAGVKTSGTANSYYVTVPSSVPSVQ